MKSIDYFNKEIISLENAKKFLNQEEYENFENFSVKLREELLLNVLEKPIDNWNEVTELYFRGKWANLFNQLYSIREISVLEIASGDADMIPQSLSISNPNSKYISANMNKILNDSLIRKTKDLNIKLELIDDDASKIRNYIKDNEIDIIAFQHGVNDVLQAMLCSRENIDTVNSEWMDCLPKMIELVKKEVENSSFEQSLKKPFIEFINELSHVLKQDGIIAINHYMFELDLNWGYPRTIFEELIPIIRTWLATSEYVEEISFDGFAKQWWIFLKKKISYLINK